MTGLWNRKAFEVQGLAEEFAGAILFPIELRSGEAVQVGVRTGVAFARDGAHFVTCRRSASRGVDATGSRR